MRSRQKAISETRQCRRVFSLRAAVAALCLSAAAVAHAQTSPVLLYASAKAGPNQGWQGSPVQGAAITIWGKNFGASRGSSFVTVGGVALTSDSSYVEWGATTNPTTAKGLQRITFWLNSSMPAGNAGGISVTVNGAQSTTLPFTINSTSSIRFIDGTNGNDSWDGQYKDNSLGGTHGPWKTAFMYTQRAGTGPGTFFYLRGGTYTAIFDPSSGHPASAYVGYFEEGGTNCNVYYPTIDGTDALRYTVTSYPGELATFLNVEIDNMSSFWTFANFRWTATTPIWAITLGNEWAMCADCQKRSTGLDLIGMQFDGTEHHVVHSFGDNFRILANYINVVPVTYSSFDVTTSYPLYLSGGDGLLVADNEIHGGAMYSIHHYDEYRCSASNDLNRYMTNSTFDSNLFDLTQSSVTPEPMRAGILTGSGLNATSNNIYSNTVIRNNIFMSRDNLVTEAGVVLFSSAAGSYNGVHIDNNTINGVPAGVWVFYDTMSTWQNVDFINNIFSNIGSWELYVDGGSAVNIKPYIDHNLMAGAPRVNGSATIGTNIIGQPAYVNAPSDFHLTSSSPAIDAGVTVGGITRDFDTVSRPQGSAFDLGAYEYIGAAGVTPSISVGVNPTSVSLSGGQSQQFTATVSGTSNTGVTWTLSPIVGSLSTAGFYTAPSSISSQQTVQVTATSVADGTKSATALVTLNPPAPVVSVSVSPTTASLSASQTQQFSATVSGSSNTSVTWSLSAAVGTVSASGLYTAPSSIASQQTVQVIATSAADTTKSATATITLNPPAQVVSVSLSPATSTLSASQTQQFTATVTGSSNTGVSWSMSPAVGTLSSSGLFTAPSSITTQQTVQVKATSTADTTKSATATVTLNPPASAVSVSVSPATVSLTASQTQQFAATVSGSSSTGVTWKLSSAVGTISTSGLYTAPSSITSQQTVQVIATSTADTTKSATATVTLNPAQSSSYSVTMSQISATQLSISWTAPAGHNTYDRIWLTGYGAPNWWYAAQWATGSATSGTFVTTVPAGPGIYQFRYVASSGNQVMASSAYLPVNITGFSVTPSVTTVAKGSKFTVTFTAPPGRPQTWADTVGLYIPSAQNNSPISYQYTMGATSGSFVVTAPSTAGTYELRYDLGYLIGAKSVPITVQ